MPEKVKKHFEAYAETVKDDSPLYSYIAKHLAQSETLMLHLKPHFFNANFISLYLTALLKQLYQHDHSLRDYFLNFTSTPLKPDKDLIKNMISFQSEHFNDILRDIEHYSLKKNVVERSSVLIPVIQHIMNLSGHKTFNVIELGSIGGLLLNYDWYGYTFNKKIAIGNTDDFNMKIKLNGFEEGFDVNHLMHPNTKIGITNRKMDLSSEEDYLWLLSLYFPEETKLRKHFIKARKVFQHHPVEIIEGDEISLLPNVIEGMPEDEPIIIFHIHVTKNWSDEKKQTLMDIITKYSNNYEIYHVHHQIFNNDIYLDTYVEDYLQRQKLAHFNLNTLTIDWLHNQKIIF